MPLPFATLHQVLHPVQDQLHLLPGPQADALRGVFGTGPGRGGDPFLVAVAALTLLGEVAGEHGLLCLVDDAHWLDPASAEALVFVARRLEAEGVAIVFAARDGDVREFRADGLPERYVHGLDEAAARALLAESAPGLTDEVCRRLVAGTAGNPLALLELPATLSRDQLAGRETLPVPLAVGHEVEQLFIARVRRLSPAAQHFLLVAAAESAGDLAAVLRAATLAGIGEGVLDESERGRPGERAGRAAALPPPAGPLRDLPAGHVPRPPLGARRPRSRAHRSGRRRPAGLARRRRRDRAGRRARRRRCEATADRARDRGGAAAAADALVRAAQLSPSGADRAARYVAAAGDAWQAGQWQRVPSLLDAAEPGRRAGRGARPAVVPARDARAAVRAAGRRVPAVAAQCGGVHG